jgi:hypothetical protein
MMLCPPLPLFNPFSVTCDVVNLIFLSNTLHEQHANKLVVVINERNYHYRCRRARRRKQSNLLMYGESYRSTITRKTWLYNDRSVPVDSLLLYTPRQRFCSWIRFPEGIPSPCSIQTETSSSFPVHRE